MSERPGSFRKPRVIERLILAVIVVTVMGTAVVACTQFTPASNEKPAGSSVAAPQPQEPATDPDAVDDMKSEMRREAAAGNAGTDRQPEANEPEANGPEANGPTPNNAPLSNVNPVSAADNSGDTDDDRDDNVDDADDLDDLDDAD